MDFDFDKFDDNKKVDDLEPPVDYRKDEKEIEPPEEEKRTTKRKSAKSRQNPPQVMTALKQSH